LNYNTRLVREERNKRASKKFVELANENEKATQRIKLIILTVRDLANKEEFVVRALEHVNFENQKMGSTEISNVKVVPVKISHSYFDDYSEIYYLIEELEASLFEFQKDLLLLGLFLIKTVEVEIATLSKNTVQAEEWVFNLLLNLNPHLKKRISLSIPLEAPNPEAWSIAEQLYREDKSGFYNSFNRAYEVGNLLK
jgi:hypothetical protein